MSKRTKKTIILFFTLAFLFFFSASFVLAQGPANPNDTTGGPTSHGGAGLQNPLGTADPRVIVGNVIKALLGVVGSLALLVVILGGFMWVISAGNEEKIKKGKDMVTWAAFGLVVIFFAYALVTFVVNAVTGGGSSVDQRNNPDTEQQNND